MKNIIFITLLMLTYSIGLYGQTAEAEKKRLTERYQQKDFDEITYLEMAKEWNDILKRVEGYPDLPYNAETNQIDFKWIQVFPELSKRIIYNRVLEWCAINYGNLETVMHYQDFESGKIIVKGYFEFYNIKRINRLFKDPLEETICNHILVFTLHDNSLKVETKYLNYTFTNYTWDSNYNLIANSYNLPITILYPVTDADMLDWMKRLSVLHETNKSLNGYATDLFKYIDNYNKDYDF